MTIQIDGVPEYGVGIVGFGFIGKVHAYGYQNLPLFYKPPPATCRLVGVCTSRAETAEKARQVGGFEFGTDRFEDLLERDDIQVISVATPNGLHRDQVIAALEAGKHVYCDKPLTVSLADARAMMSAAEAHPDLATGMAFQCRFSPAVLKAHEMIHEGFLGQVYHFRGAYLHAGYTDPNRPRTWRTDEGGGCLADLGSHIIDLMRYLLGEYDAVRGATKTWVTERPSPDDPTRMLPVDVDDYVCLEARLASGAIGFIEASRYATGVQDHVEFAIHGEGGALRWSMMDPNYLYAYRAGSDPNGFVAIPTVQHYPSPSALAAGQNVGWMRFHMHSVFDFMSGVATGETNSSTLRDGAHVQAIDEAVRSSADSGDWEPVPEL
jgi:predicted dehydrogenase